MDFHRLASGLHPGRGVDRISEQTVPRHLHADNAGHHGTGVYAHADLQMRFCKRNERDVTNNRVIYRCKRANPR